MPSYRFVLYSMMIQEHCVLICIYFNINQVFYSVNVMQVPFEFQTLFWLTTNTIDHQILIFKHRFIEQIKYFLIVKLQERYPQCNFPIIFHANRLKHLYHITCASLHNAALLSNIICSYRLQYSFIILLVLVAFHCICFPSSCLPVSKHSCVVASKQRFSHFVDACFLIKICLRGLTIKCMVKFKHLWFFVPRIEVKLYYFIIHDSNYAARVC